MKLKSKKLTKQVREAIVNDIVDSSFEGRIEDIRKRRQRLSEKTYNDIYKGKEREQMDSLPEGWLPTAETITVQFGSARDGYCRRSFEKPVRVLAKHCENYGQVIKVYDDNHKLTKEHHQLTKDMDKCNEDYKKALGLASSVVASCSTTSQLREAWPEVSKYIEKYEPSEESSCTAIIPATDAVNKLLGF